MVDDSNYLPSPDSENLESDETVEEEQYAISPVGRGIGGIFWLARVSFRSVRGLFRFRWGVLGASLAVAAGVVLSGGVSANAGGGQVFVNCQTFEHGRFAYNASVRPSACVFQGLPPSGSKEWKLTSLRWSGWGTSIAVATGLYHYRHGEYRDGRFVYPVVSTRIVLSRIRVGCDGRRYYTSVGDGEGTNRLSTGCIAS